MSVTGTVTGIAIDIQSVFIKQDGTENATQYRFAIPYTTQKGKLMETGASRMVLSDDGSCRYKSGDRVNFSYGIDNEGRYLKFIGGYESMNAPPPDVAKFSVGKPDTGKSIYAMHAEKICASFLTENVDLVDTKNGAVDQYTAFLTMVIHGRDVLVSNMESKNRT